MTPTTCPATSPTTSLRTRPSSATTALTVASHRARILAEADASVVRLAWHRDQIERWQRDRLRLLLARAVECSPFHRERLSAIDPAAFDLADLATLPVMTKAELMADFDRVVTDPRLTRATVEAHLARCGDELDYLFGTYLVMASGGSSGERGLFVYDADAVTEFVLALGRTNITVLRSLGITPAEPVAAVLVAAGTTVHGTRVVASLLGGDGGLLRFTSVPATLPFDEVVARVEAAAPVVLVGYPTMLDRLAAAKAEGRLTIAPFVVSATSEPMSPETRGRIEAAFGVPVGNTFGSTEGLCGLSAPGEDAIRFCEDGCIVELVDAAGHPVGPGEIAAKVLLTNLTNLTQPLIRYELPDRFRAVEGPWPDGHLRATVEGRSDEPLRWGGIEIHPLVVRSALVHVADLFEYQVHQRPDGLHLDVVASASMDLERIGASVTAGLVAAGFPGAVVTVAPVDAVPRDPSTGKARRFVPMPVG